MESREPQFGELLKGNTPTLILAVLSDGPLHGYGIAREIERRSEDALSLGEGSLYPALRSLERAEFVEGRWEPQSSGPARKVYVLTDEGKAELARRERSWRAFSEAVDRVLPRRSPHAEPA